MRLARLGALLVSAPVMLAACGVTTPDMQELGETNIRLGKTELVGEIKCEIQRGIYQALTDPNFAAGAANPGKPIDWLLDWVVKVDLQITVDDKGTFGPGVTLTTPFATSTQSFSLGVGIQASTEAQHKEDIGFIYPIQDLYKVFKAEVEANPPKRNAQAPCGANGAFIHGDLKIEDFIHQNIFLARPEGIIYSPFNAFNDTVEFIIVYGGSVTPEWKLVRFSVNPSSPFASAMRTRTQYLTLTFGPPDKTTSGAAAPHPALPAAEPAAAPQLNAAAEALHNAGLIGQAVESAIRSSISP